MEKTLKTEKMVKDELNINSFLDLATSKAIEFADLLPQVDKDVAIGIINQFQNYSQTVTEMVNRLTEVCKSIIDSHNLITKYAIEAYQKILDNLNIMLQRDDLTFDERQQITSSMIDVADKIAALETKNTDFLLTVGKYALGTVLSLATIIVLGVKFKSINLSQVKS